MVFPQYRDKPPAICVYTVCDESKYLIVKNVPSLGCGDELSKLFGSYGDIEECKPMDAEDCEPFTDVYWIKFSQVNNARFAKRKLDESVFLGNRLQVSYASQFESLSDTKEKLEARRMEVLRRIKYGSSDGSKSHPLVVSESQNSRQSEHTVSGQTSTKDGTHVHHVSSNREYFLSSSMNETVQLVRAKLDKIKSSSESIEAGPSSKKLRVDNRRRI